MSLLLLWDTEEGAMAAWDEIEGGKLEGGFWGTSGQSTGSPVEGNLARAGEHSLTPNHPVLIILNPESNANSHIFVLFVFPFSILPCQHTLWSSESWRTKRSDSQSYRGSAKDALRRSKSVFA